MSWQAQIYFCCFTHKTFISTLLDQVTTSLSPFNSDVKRCSTLLWLNLKAWTVFGTHGLKAAIFQFKRTPLAKLTLTTILWIKARQLTTSRELRVTRSQDMARVWRKSLVWWLFQPTNPTTLAITKVINNVIILVLRLSGGNLFSRISVPLWDKKLMCVTSIT